jgi:hypothetical protein
MGGRTTLKALKPMIAVPPSAVTLIVTLGIRTLVFYCRLQQDMLCDSTDVNLLRS